MKKLLLLSALFLFAVTTSFAQDSNTKKDTQQNSNKTQKQKVETKAKKKKGKQTPPPELGTIAGLEAEAFYLGLDAVIWGYPSVLFEDLMRGRTSPEILKKGNPQSAVNQFGMVRHLRGPEYKQIATPNNDTFYAQSFCDVSKEPIILTVPAVDNTRYYAMQLWDPNGDTFGYIGTRTTGREAGSYALVGPNWKGNLPANVKRIDSPYNSLVVWGRIGVDGVDDGCKKFTRYWL
jgi:hypothetical protein